MNDGLSMYPRAGAVSIGQGDAEWGMAQFVI